MALAWLRAQPTVVAPIASARDPEQLAELLPVAELELDRGRAPSGSAQPAQPS